MKILCAFHRSPTCFSCIILDLSAWQCQLHNTHMSSPCSCSSSLMPRISHSKTFALALCSSTGAPPSDRRRQQVVHRKKPRNKIYWHSNVKYRILKWMVKSTFRAHSDRNFVMNIILVLSCYSQILKSSAHASTLRYPLVYESTLKYPLVCVSTLRYPLVYESTLRYPLVCVSTLRYPLVYKSTLRYPLVCVNTLGYPLVYESTLRHPLVCVSTLGYPLVYDSTLSYPPVYEGTLRYPLVYDSTLR